MPSTRERTIERFLPVFQVRLYQKNIFCFEFTAENLVLDEIYMQENSSAVMRGKKGAAILYRDEGCPCIVQKSFGGLNDFVLRVSFR